MKKTLLVLMALLSLFAFVSCSDNADKSDTELMVVDTSAITVDGLAITVKPNSLISMDNVSLKDGIMITSFDSRGVNNSRKAEDSDSQSENLFRTQFGDFYMVPNGKGHVEFTGEQVNANSEITMTLRKYDRKNNANDFKMSKTEYPNLQSDVVDEYYYFDFADYPDIKKNNVVIVGANNNAISSYSVVQYGQMHNNINGIFNFAGNDGFGLYAYVAWNGSSSTDWQWEYKIQNPVSLKQATNNQVVVQSGEYKVLDFDMQKNQHYKIELSYTCNSNDEDMLLEKLFGDHFARYYTGLCRDRVLIPKIDKANKKVYLYTGNVDDFFIFDVNLYNFENATVTVKVEQVQSSETPEFTELSTINGCLTVTDLNSSDYYVFPYSCSKEGYYRFEDITSPSNNYWFMNYSRSATSHGNGPIENSYISENLTGYVIAKYQGQTRSTDLLRVSPSLPEFINSTHIKFDNATKKYVSQDDSSVTYSYSDIFKFTRTSFDASFVAPVAVEGFGSPEFEIRNIEGVCIPEFAMTMFTSENIWGDNGEWGMLCYDGDRTYLKAKIILKEAWFDENKVATKVLVSLHWCLSSEQAEAPEPYNFVNAGDIEFTYKHLHKWEVNSQDNMVECSCGEKRSCISRYINAGVATMNVSGLKEGDDLICYVPFYEYTQTIGNGTTIFPALEQKSKVYFLAPLGGAKLTLSGNNKNYNLKVKY